MGTGSRADVCNRRLGPSSLPICHPLTFISPNFYGCSPVDLRACGQFSSLCCGWESSRPQCLARSHRPLATTVENDYVAIPSFSKWRRGSAERKV
jgi:hypothetical protein